MNLLETSAAVLAFTTLAIHLVSCALAAWRCRPSPRPRPSGPDRPTTLLRPVCGLDHDAHRTLSSSFTLAHPDYEVIFCVADPGDPALPLLRDLRDRHPHVPCRILVGRDRFPHNPKLDNAAKGWDAARHDHVVMADSNIVLPPDYLARLDAMDGPSVGLVSAPPIGADARGWWAELECAVLNGYQARIQYAVDTLGFGFAQGKTLAMRRSVLGRAGGYAALAREPAEDAAATKIMRGLGLRIRLAAPPCPQPLGRRTAREVWARQVRWARLRRASFPLLFAPEILSGGLVPLAAAIVAAPAGGVTALPMAAGWICLWYGAEAALSAVARWPLTWRSPLLWLLRDASIPAVYAAALAGRSFAWRGTTLTADAPPPTRGMTIATQFSVDCDRRFTDSAGLRQGVR